MLKLLRDYPIVMDIPVAWGEMDSLQHVNNIVYFRYFESVRMAFFDRIEFWPSINESGIGQSLGQLVVGLKYR